MGKTAGTGDDRLDAFFDKNIDGICDADSKWFRDIQ